LDIEKSTKEVIKLPIWLALHLAKLGDAAKDLGIQPDLAELIGREAKTHYMQQLASMEQFEHSFKEAIKKTLGPNGRLVVFVDDLDRCLPEKVVEILEAIKLFLNVPQTVFVLGMDRDIVCRGIESHYGVFLPEDSNQREELPIDGNAYLQKLIQLPFNLPPLNADGREKFIASLEDQMSREAKLDETTLQVFARGLLPNPRQVKRALNVYNLLRKIAEEQEKQDLIPKNSIAWPLLAKTVLIQSQWPELYGLWRQYPTLVQTLEEKYEQQPLTEREIITGQIAELEEDIPDQVKSAEARKQTASSRPAEGGLLAPFLTQRRKYARLMALISFTPESEDDRERSSFRGLSRVQLQVYLGLAGTAEQETAQPEEASLPSDLIAELQSGDPAIIDDVLARIGEQEEDTEGPLHKGIKRTLLQTAQNPELAPPTRAANADALDELGYLPDDLHTFVPIPADQTPQFHIGRYQVTNVQYRRFLKADDFAQKDYWIDFPKFSEPDKQTGDIKQLGDWGEEGWWWLQNNWNDEKKVLPRYWNDTRFGISRKGVPLVGITWYEANAYCKWLLAHWDDLAEGEENPGWKPELIRLPTEREWALAAGGEDPSDRYPWDKKGQVTEKEAEILRRANVKESGIGRTTPVAMYPLGVSPHGVWDMGGNVREWCGNYYDSDHAFLGLRGGAFDLDLGYARAASRHVGYPRYHYYDLGVRVVLAAPFSPSSDL
jgi:formylglycine-generating enzyme required for sulfatase activity